MPMLKSIISPLSRALVHSISRQIKSSTPLRNGTVLLRRGASRMSIPRSQQNGEKTSAEASQDQFMDENNENEDEINEREFHDHHIEEFENLYKNDDTGTIKEKIELVLQEYDYHKYNSFGRVPSKIDSFEMGRLLEEGLTPNSREKLFHFLFKREMVRRSSARKKELDRVERAKLREVKIKDMVERHKGSDRTGLLSPGGDLIYGLWHNSLFCRIPDNRFKAGAPSKLVQAALYGRKLIFDFDFESQMEPYVYRNVVEQVQDAYGINKHSYDEPFDLWFCNFDEKTKGNQYMVQKTLRNLHDGSMITVKNDCFTKYFDKSRLVYLTPDAKVRLSDVCSNDDIYIIGVYNDKGSVRPLTYRKACDLGIRTRSLPLDSYVAWRGGSKSLCVNHVTGILLEAITNGGDWRSAFMKHIPQRKIKPIDMIIEEEGRRKAKLNLKKRKTFNIREDLDLFS